MSKLLKEPCGELTGD